MMLALLLALQAVDDPAADVAALLQNVREIAAPGSPGSVAVWGPRAFPVVTGLQGKDRVPVAAAGRWEQGRVVILSHDGFLAADAAKIADTGVFLANAIRWASGRPEPRVVRPGERWTPGLDSVDVLLLARSNLTDAESADVSAFVRRGGGLVAALTGWGWLQGARGKGIQENALNRLLLPAGLGWTADFASKTGPAGFLAAAPPPLCHGLRALETLCGTAPPAGDELRQAGTTLMNVVRLLPPGHEAIRPKLDGLLGGRAAALVPTAKVPLRSKSGLDRVLLAYQVEQIEALPPAKVTAHPASAEFPGALPAGAVVVTKILKVDGSIPGWHSTGLYARPGHVVVVEAPEGARTTVRVGAHVDRLWHHDSWSRVPAVTRTVVVRSTKTELASAFGGLLYLEVQDGKPLQVTISGAVEAPAFVLGKTTPEEWKRVRSLPAPWAELGTSKVILTVPSTEIRDLEDPVPLLEFWDRFMDAASDLGALPRARPRPERYVADVQISAGYMHSGYPIMTHLDAARTMARLEEMKKGPWGLAHELGHNHQAGEWTFEGTGEVTNNLWSLYLLETVCGVAGKDAHDGMKNPAAKIAAHRKAGAPFEKWKSDPFLALQMYVQLQQEFGWDVFKKVFAEYRALPRDQRPRGDAEERDQWMLRFSRAAGRNLGPFFEVWGVPTSVSARESLKELPGWLPENLR